MTDLDKDAAIRNSWRKNVDAWTDAVRNQEIPSRHQVTDGAIIKAILDQEPRTLVDLGCGEGWLARALSHTRISVTGFDGEPGLIEQARAAGGGQFYVAPYEALVRRDLESPVDAIVANFSLLGETTVNDLFRWAPRQLTAKGVFIVQTVHPHLACGDMGYTEGWRPGSWEGFSDAFVDPSPWYFRTLESWARLFTGNGLRITSLREPLNPETALPASVILVGQKPH